MPEEEEVKVLTADASKERLRLKHNQLILNFRKQKNARQSFGTNLKTTPNSSNKQKQAKSSAFLLSEIGMKDIYKEEKDSLRINANKDKTPSMFKTCTNKTSGNYSMSMKKKHSTESSEFKDNLKRLFNINQRMPTLQNRNDYIQLDSANTVNSAQFEYENKDMLKTESRRLQLESPKHPLNDVERSHTSQSTRKKDYSDRTYSKKLRTEVVCWSESSH